MFARSTANPNGQPLVAGSRFLALCILLPILGSSASAGEISHERGTRWYREHRESVHAINEFLLLRPLIERIEPQVRLKFVAKYGEFDETYTRDYGIAKSWCDSSGVVGIAVARENSEATGELISITYTLETRGILISPDAAAVSVEYIPNPDTLETLREYWEASGEHDLMPLGDDHWFVMVYQNR